MSNYSNGAVANASAGQALFGIIDTQLTATAGISKVDAALVVGTLTWNVYKSAAGSNAQGADFFFAVGYPTAANNSICFTAFEGYNNATHLASNYAPNVGNNTPVANYANPGPAIALPSTGAMAYLQSSNIPANFTYAINSNANRVLIGIYGAATNVNDGYYIGLYDPVMSAADDPFPLVCVNLTKQVTTPVQLGGTPIAQTGFSTREPKQLIANSVNFAVGGGSSTSWTQTGPVSTTDPYMGWFYVHRTPIFGRNQGFRGLLKDTFISTVQSNNGDQLQWTLNAVNYVGTRLVSTGIYMLNN